jgi:hypothetical protein
MNRGWFRRPSAAFAMGVGALVVALVPTAALGAGNSLQSVAGSGWRGTVAHPTTPITHFAVRAQNGPQGVSGTYSSMNSGNPLLNFNGEVTCLYIAGDHAIVGGVVTSGGEPGQLGTGFAIGFIDNPSLAPDSVTFSDVELAAPVDCAAEASLFTLETFAVLDGNVVVSDAS